MKRINLLLIILIVTINMFSAIKSNEIENRSISINPDWSVTENNINDRYGHSVSSAGDVNGDGLDDILVGAYYFDNGGKYV